MEKEFIERRDAGFYVIGSRVPIDRIVWEYRNGEDPETTQAHFPTLLLKFTHCEYIMTVLPESSNRGEITAFICYETHWPNWYQPRRPALPECPPGPI